MFLSKYLESGRLYSRMLGVSAEIDASYPLVKRRGRTPITLKKINSARMELWKSQFNDVYWHGVFGGLYLPELRKTAYRHLINAQKILDGARNKGKGEGKRKGKENVGLEIKRKENGIVSIDSHSLGIYISARDGGTIQEIDFKPKAVNVADTITRIREAYHSEIINNQSGPMGKKINSIVTGVRGKIKGRNFHTNIIYDKYPRYSFRDYILHAHTNIANFENQRFVELAPLSVQNCRIENIMKRRKDIQFILSRHSQLQDTAIGGKAKFAVTKIIGMNRARPSLSVSYLLTSESNKSTLRGIFASEINLGSLGDQKFVKAHDRIREVEKCDSTKIRYEELGFSLEFTFSPSTSLWLIPIKTVSKSEEGIESKVQGLSIVPHWPVESILGKRVEVNLRFY
jgi:alpha-amylase